MINPELDKDIGWEERAACVEVHPSVFFPSDGVGVEAAKEICRSCLVVESCLEYALETNQDHGVWGGTSERQRRKIKKAWSSKSLDIIQ